MVRPRTLTTQQLLEDAESEYTSAVYLFRKAEEKKSADYNEARREMNRLERRLLLIRECIYNNKPEILFRKKGSEVRLDECPAPEWS